MCPTFSQRGNGHILRNASVLFEGSARGTSGDSMRELCSFKACMTDFLCFSQEQGIHIIHRLCAAVPRQRLQAAREGLHVQHRVLKQGNVSRVWFVLFGMLLSLMCCDGEIVYAAHSSKDTWAACGVCHVACFCHFYGAMEEL